MSEQQSQAGAAENLEQRYVDEHAETEEVLEGLDPSNPDRDAVDEVEAVGDHADSDVDRMAGEQ